MTILPLVHCQSLEGRIFLTWRPIRERLMAFESLRREKRHAVEIVFDLQVRGSVKLCATGTSNFNSLSMIQLIAHVFEVNFLTSTIGTQ